MRWGTHSSFGEVGSIWSDRTYSDLSTTSGYFSDFPSSPSSPSFNDRNFSRSPSTGGFSLPILRLKSEIDALSNHKAKCSFLKRLTSIEEQYQYMSKREDQIKRKRFLLEQLKEDVLQAIIKAAAEYYIICSDSFWRDSQQNFEETFAFALALENKGKSVRTFTLNPEWEKAAQALSASQFLKKVGELLVHIVMTSGHGEKKAYHCLKKHLGLVTVAQEDSQGIVYFPKGGLTIIRIKQENVYVPSENLSASLPAAVTGYRLQFQTNRSTQPGKVHQTRRIDSVATLEKQVKTLEDELATKDKEHAQQLQALEEQVSDAVDAVDAEHAQRLQALKKQVSDTEKEKQQVAEKKDSGHVTLSPAEATKVEAPSVATPEACQALKDKPTVIGRLLENMRKRYGFYRSAEVRKLEAVVSAINAEANRDQDVRAYGGKKSVYYTTSGVKIPSGMAQILNDIGDFCQRHVGKKIEESDFDNLYQKVAQLLKTKREKSQTNSGYCAFFGLRAQKTKDFYEKNAAVTALIKEAEKHKATIAPSSLLPYVVRPRF